MTFQEKIKEIDQRKWNIEEHGKLGKELLQKINYKFRLDWNYYSNRMEGNTLSIDETKSVMVGSINVHNKSLKEILEMKGHDEAIQSILQIGKGELNISESRIRLLHSGIMYEDNPIEREKIGKWKMQPNHVINYRGEKFEFANPDEVAEKTHDLINWTSAENENIQAQRKNSKHPVALAFEFHLRYLTIHPFYDGNGRTGRILTNLILVRYGYPPIYIKDGEKDLYYRYLADVQAYGANQDMLFELMADYLIRSLEIVLNAIAGKEIAEPDDLDKKLQLLERELGAIEPENEVKIKYSKDIFLACYDSWVSKLINTTVPVIEKFNKLFKDNEHTISLQQSGIYVKFSSKPVSGIIDEVKRKIVASDRIEQYPQDFRIEARYGNLIKGGLKSFSCNYSIIIKFNEISYDILVDDFDDKSDGRRTEKKYEYLLHQPLSEEEMTDVATMLGNTIFNHIDYHTKKNGLRK
jgi:Fic family protein